MTSLLAVFIRYIIQSPNQQQPVCIRGLHKTYKMSSAPYPTDG